MKVSELLGKPLISLADSCVEGILKDVIFDSRIKKAQYLVLFDDKNEQDEKIVPSSAVLCYGEDALVVKNNDVVLRRDQLAERNNNPISKTVFNTTGKVMGRITDISLCDRLTVQCLELNGKPLPSKEVASFSDELVIVYDGKKIKLQRQPSARQADSRTVKVQPIEFVPSATALPVQTATATPVQNSNATPVQTATLPPVQTAVRGSASVPPSVQAGAVDEPNHNPQRIIGNYAFLLGRRVTSDIFNQRGDVIVSADTLITPETVENARRYGRLVELTLHSLPI